MVKIYKVKLKIIILLISFIFIKIESNNNLDTISVEKNSVIYNFVKNDPATDHFCQNVFPYWEADTFNVFQSVADKEGIAIDLGGWIGTTCIWLSKNFKHVITVEADKISLECLKKNLKASNCDNVDICPIPISNLTKNFIFGPRKELNDSCSYIKDVSNHKDDYIVKSITFKQIMHDYIYANNDIENKKISFIKCDIEGGEEDIIEDLLYFAHHNKVKVWLSFHLDWWKSKKIEDFDYLFNFFKISHPSLDNIEIYNYLRNNPFGSLLFEPLELNKQLIKKNIPAIIIGYNQYTYIKNMVEQLEKYTSDIIIIDNNSSFQPLLDYYSNDFKYTLLRQKTNLGYMVYKNDFIDKLSGKIFILTDPDIKFNSVLPDNFIENLVDISNHFGAGKVGFALKIDFENMREAVLPIIKSFENNYWITKLGYDKDLNLEAYKAPIDTTFALCNTNYPQDFENHIRIAGNYVAMHMPWYKNYKNLFLPGEYESYINNNNSSFYIK